MIVRCLRIGLGGLAICAAFVLPAGAQAPLADRTVLTRFHSPTFGDPSAKVEIVEFFDPACEACRAMYPYVKKLLEEHRGRVRLTLRYVPFHKGADEIVKLLEAARRQGKYAETLEVLLSSQPNWAVRHVARLDLALKAVEGIGLDMARLKADMATPDLARLIKQDMEDAISLKVTRTPIWAIGVLREDPNMALFKQVVEAYIASKDPDQAALSRLDFWVEELGDRELTTITHEDIDTALVKLAERGSLRGGKRPTAAAGKPLAGATMNRYLTQAGSIFKHAKRLKLVPHAFVRPTLGIERAPERANPERYLSPEEVVRLVAVARVLDRHWGKMTALIVVAYHTGFRVGSLLTARGKQLDLVAGTLTVPHTKNGDAITAGLSSAAIAELKRLPKAGRDELIFGNRAGKPFTYTPLWRRIAAEARLEGRVFHELRHGHGYQLARAGVSQQMIMKSMGHRTLTASARYAHASIEDKKAVIAKVFG